MGLKIKGLSAVLRKFQRTEETMNRAGLAAMRDAAKVVVMAAKLRAPVDTGDLENAIVAQERRSRNGLGQFGSVTIEVGVDPSKLNLEDHGGYDYSIRMHEDPNYNLGPKSEVKQAALPGIQVGYKYLSRALEDTRSMVLLRTEVAMKKAVKEI